jgi:TDG/mug DNA glycosylase family protein
MQLSGDGTFLPAGFPTLTSLASVTGRFFCTKPLTTHRSSTYCCMPLSTDTTPRRPRPTRAELLAAVNRRVPDVLAPGLRILFCGINPGLYSAWARHHFARPGNRFWPALFAGGLTERLLQPQEERELLRWGYGITNLLERPTNAADELSAAELRTGARILRRKLERYAPRVVAILGVSAYRLAFERPKAQLGPQPERLGRTLVWVLPNPSGLNAHFTPKALAKLFQELRRHLEAAERGF